MDHGEESFNTLLATVMPLHGTRDAPKRVLPVTSTNVEIGSVVESDI